MTPRFYRHLKLMTALHIALALTLVVVTACRRFSSRRPEVIIPVTLVSAAALPAAQPERDVSRDIPDPVEPVEPVRPPDPLPRRRPPVKVSSKRVVREHSTPPPPRRHISEEMLRQALDAEREAADGSATDEDARCLGLVRQALYGAWVQPSAAEAGGRTVGASLSLLPAGRVAGHRLTSPSGNSVLDESVLRALRTVRQIRGLSEEFVQRHPTVEIAFRVE